MSQSLPPPPPPLPSITPDDGNISSSLSQAGVRGDVQKQLRSVHTGFNLAELESGLRWGPLTQHSTATTTLCPSLIAFLFCRRPQCWWWCTSCFLKINKKINKIEVKLMHFILVCVEIIFLTNLLTSPETGCPACNWSEECRLNMKSGSSLLSCPLIGFNELHRKCEA